MRVLIVHNRHQSSTASGEDRVVDQEHLALGQAGHEVWRFERSNDEIPRLSLARKALLPAQAVWNLRAVRELDRVLEEFRPDVVHVHNLVPLLSSSVLRVCERKCAPCVVTLHNYQLLCLNGSLFRDGAECRLCTGRTFRFPGVVHTCYRESRLESAGLALSTAVARRFWLSVPSAYIFLSEAQRRELQTLDLPPERCFVKSNLAPPVAGPRADDGSVVYLGRLNELKGLRVLMRAWDRYVGTRQAPRLRLVIAGAGPLESEVRSWARSRPSVEVRGLLPRADAADLLRRATTVVVPSEWREPFGLVVAEAMAAGAAPIATAHGSFEELISDGVDGLLYPPGDADGLAGLLLRVEDDPLWAARLGVAARATYERRFAPARIVAELEAIYRFVVARPRWLGTSEPTSPPPQESDLPSARRALGAPPSAGREPLPSADQMATCGHYESDAPSWPGAGPHSASAV